MTVAFLQLMNRHVYTGQYYYGSVYPYITEFVAVLVEIEH